ncbi:toll/interleukin-1 receptor domain-containing protein [Paenibacillus sp. 11B]|uniref:toll/interleukin-1 receptor domain-containing protein n=2 Tax=Bacteria TaxID=2 RepID=UPI00265211C9|nr:toll/interleukin-1 receptor domain-containing protein [Paenibacillus sp. 11B]MDN8593169.1 toll/interleukin-1 receptor domain-containing protein [Paenibacillus sp. 11B]
MSKIFISHASTDWKFVNTLMDLFQNQFNLTRENFFNTSDEELKTGGNWVEQIREGMQGADLIMPIFTPSYFESTFCICELGAAWVNQANLVPLIVPPLTHRALDETPYRSVIQTISLGNRDGLTKLWDAFTERGIGQNTNMTRFLKRAEDFQTSTLEPFIEEMSTRETVTVSLVRELRKQMRSAEEAYEEVEDELTELRAENKRLREMKDANAVKVMDDEKMDEWDTFSKAVEQVKESMKSLNKTACSMLYYTYNNKPFTGDQYTNGILSNLEGQGLTKWDDGWYVDEEHPSIRDAETALNNLAKVISNWHDTIQDRFYRENPGIRFGLQFSTCWEELFGVSVIPSE